MSLFSGIGGFDLAAEWMGWTNVAHCEWNAFGQRVLNYYWPNAISYHDITKTDFTIHRGAIDIVTGGFPCQDISAANFNAEGITGSRSGLWSEYARCIQQVRPNYVLIENSPQLLRKGFEKVLFDLSEIGYNAEWECFTAKAFGLPH